MSASRETESGRALDAEIAEKVMGWARWANYQTGDWGGPDDVTFFAPWEDGVAVYKPEDDGDVSFYFAPSQDIESAWMVVDKMHAFADGGVLSLCLSHWDDGWNALFYVWGASEATQMPMVVADTAPLAICRAALSAVSSAPPERTPV